MSLEQQIADAIVIAFDELGGDPQQAVRQALYHRTVDSFSNDETTKIALAGGAEMAIPGLHMLTIPLGISYLLRKMATIGWGIGALKGAYIVETAGFSDLRNILILYANDNLYNGNLLDFQAIQCEAYTYALTNEGYTRLLGVTEDNERVDVTARTWRVLRNLAEEYPTDEAAYRLLRTMVGDRTANEAKTASQGRYVTKMEDVDPMERRIGAKLALKLATQISARVPARFVMGFIPIAGAVVNAFFNAQTLRDYARAADAYYSQQMTKDDLLRL